MQKFPRCESKSNDQINKVVRFYPWELAIPYFSEGEIVASCRALNGSITGNHEELVQAVQIKLYQQLTLSGNCSRVTTIIANRWKKLDDQCRSNQNMAVSVHTPSGCLNIYTQWQY